HLLQRVDPESHPLMRVPERNSRGLVLLVTSDRGLCGGYNANLTRSLEAFLLKDELEYAFHAVGRKGAEHLKRVRRSMANQYAMPVAADAARTARELARALERLYLGGEVDRVYVVYTAFRSTLSQVPTIEQLLPLQHHDEPEDPGG